MTRVIFWTTGFGVVAVTLEYTKSFYATIAVAELMMALAGIGKTRRPPS